MGHERKKKHSYVKYVIIALSGVMIFIRLAKPVHDATKKRSDLDFRSHCKSV